MTRVLLIDADQGHAKRIIEGLAGRGLRVELFATVPAAISRLKQPGLECELVVINVSDGSQPWLRSLEMLQGVSHQSVFAAGPLFLCVSTVKREPLFELQIERMGGRLVYER